MSTKLENLKSRQKTALWQVHLKAHFHFHLVWIYHDWRVRERAWNRETIRVLSMSGWLKAFCSFVIFQNDELNEGVSERRPVNSIMCSQGTYTIHKVILSYSYRCCLKVDSHRHYLNDDDICLLNHDCVGVTVDMQASDEGMKQGHCRSIDRSLSSLARVNSPPIHRLQTSCLCMYGQ